MSTVYIPSLCFFKKYGPISVSFSFILVPFTSQSNYKLKMLRWCDWDLNPGRRMLGADKTTELWRPVISLVLSQLFWALKITPPTSKKANIDTLTKENYLCWFHTKIICDFLIITHTPSDQTLKYKVAKNILTKVAQNFINENGCFQKAKTVNIHLGNFCNKICHQYLLKIAKSGPTVTRGSSYLYPDRENRRYCR